MNISVCVTTCNGESYIKEQLTSILEQVDTNDEIIICDDSSTDSTCDIIRSFNDKRIKLIENQPRIGVIKNFEKALGLAKGTYIFLSDQDDVWVENKVRTFLELLKKHDVVAADAVVVDANLQVLHPSYLEKMNLKPGFFRNLLKNAYLGGNMAFHRRVLKVALPFPNDIPMHDIWLGFIAELFFKPCITNEKLLLYRRHSFNVSSASTKSTNSLMQKLKFRFNIVKYLPQLLQRYYKGE